MELTALQEPVAESVEHGRSKTLFLVPATELPLSQVLLIALLSSALFLMTIFGFGRYSAVVDGFGDSSAYMNVSAAIRTGDFSHLVVKQFWGYPYAMAALSRLTGISDRTALLLVSYLSFFVSAVLARRLWGGWVAAFFTVLNFDWLQRALLGGSEPLFVALLFGSFLLARRERWTWASLLASLATVVRPLGIFALVGIGVVLLPRREFSRLTRATLIAATVGALYGWPLARQFGDPLATVHSYGSSKRWLFGIPFYAIIQGTLSYPMPWTNLALSFAWIAVITAGAFAMLLSRDFREHARSFPVEVLFAAPYLLSLYCYNYPVFARSSFARFAIPVVPLVLVALERWIPKNRIMIALATCVCPILAAVSALGLRNVLHWIR